MATYAQQDSAAVKRAEAEKLYPVYMNELAAYEKAHGHFIQTPNVKMHYLTWGKPSGTPLIWSHGTFGNAYDLFNFGDDLVAMGYYIIAIDYYGHGLTALPPHEVSVYHVADDIKFLMDQLKIKKAVIGGFSRGGTISTAFYDAYPSRVLGLFLEDGGSAPWPVNDHKVTTDSLTRRITESFKTRRLPSLFNEKIELFIRLYGFFGKQPTFKKTAFTYMTSLQHIDSINKWQVNVGVYDFVCQSNAAQDIMVNTRPFNAPLFAATSVLVYPKVIYRNLDVPMMIYDPTGEHSYFDFEQENNLLQKAHPDLIVHKIFPNTGHGVKDEHPAEFIKDMAVLLKTVKSRM
jgi:pimeloyl-ACP methyl ester carboxylesterase